MKALKALAAIYFLIVALGVVGQMDYDDQIKEQQRTCKMVQQGYWPAGYAKSKGINCEDYENE